MRLENQKGLQAVLILEFSIEQQKMQQHWHRGKWKDGG